eukprot:Unigene12820_Nuclearia_a/m.38921 Unigene12820_Nuclearia_a/g.38921  ORF Unigene12820_Nuclearia_a/g.38921 Unigene12820_Nuclearia_a/m.38921 type:complete len:197 (+) Unigene12820_Nuclearia_a:1547-2137(+)
MRHRVAATLRSASTCPSPRASGWHLHPLTCARARALSCGRSFASSEALFTHIRAAHRPEFVAKYGSRTRSEMFGRFLPVREHVPPTYINEGVLSKEFVEQYAHTSDGKLLWFSRPPLDVLPPVPRPVHSDAYVRFRQEQAQAEAEAEERRRADVAENAEQESAAQERYREHIEAATASNWRSLLNTLMMAGQRQAT